MREIIEFRLIEWTLITRLHVPPSHRLVNAVGIDDPRAVHDAATLIQQALRLGMPPPGDTPSMFQVLLGHAKPETTRRYTAVDALLRR